MSSRPDFHLQIRRGLDADILPGGGNVADAELLFAYDTKIMYVSWAGINYPLNGGLTVDYTLSSGDIMHFTDGLLKSITYAGSVSGLRAIHEETLRGSGGYYE